MSVQIKWISCKDRLPPWDKTDHTSSWVLIRTKNDFICSAWRCRGSDGGRGQWITYGDGIIPEEAVLYWMPFDALLKMGAEAPKGKE